MKIGRFEFRSRLILGSGKFPSPEVMVRAYEAAAVDCVTVAVRRVDLGDASRKSFLTWIDREKIKILPNTAGCFTAEEAIRTAHLGREAGLSDMVKLEVIGDQKTLMPDLPALVEATRQLVKDGFTVLPYTSDDLVTALRLQEAGASCIMPLAAPIGSGLGVLNPTTLRILIDRVEVPVIVDAGVGTASDAAVAMELGADGVLMNTGVAGAKDPVAMARAMALAVEAGRLAFEAGRIPRREAAAPSSPEKGRIE